MICHSVLLEIYLSGIFCFYCTWEIFNQDVLFDLLLGSVFCRHSNCFRPNVIYDKLKEHGSNKMCLTK